MAQTLVNTREIRIQGLISSSISRLSVSYVTLSSTSASFIRQKNASTATPSTITVTATLGDALLYNAPAYKWERSTDLAPDTWTTSGLGTSSTQVITNTNFESWVGTGAQLRLRCTVSQAYRVPISTVYIVNYIKEGSDGTSGSAGLSALTLTNSRPAIVLPSSDQGIVSSYNNSGTTIQIQEGNTLLTYVSVLSGAGQFTLGTIGQSPASTIGTLGTVSGAGTTTLTIGNHNGMAQGSDSVVLSYPLTVVRANNTTSSVTASQAITKAKAGLASSGTSGASAVFAYRVVSSASLPASPTIADGTIPTSGTATSSTSGWYVTPAGSLSASEWMFQVAGTRSADGSTYSWINPSYLSSFRVGSLSALTVSTGALTVDNTLTIGTSGSILTAGGGYTSTGIFLGSSGGVYRFSVGTGTSMLSFDGSVLSLPGGSIIGNIASNTVVNSSIAQNAISTDKIAANAITSDKVAAGAITAGSIAANAVTAGSIAANAISSDKIAAGAITAGSIAANAVTAGSIAANAVTTAKIAAGAITAGSIAANAVTAGSIAANAISSDKIAANAVTAGSIAANAITSDKIAAGAITAGSIAANAVTAGSIAANAISSDKIAANAVTAGSIAANAITTAKIAAGAITAGSIAANAVTAGSIAANAITSDKIAANAVTAGSIAANAITSDKIAANAITANSVAAGAITTSKLTVANPGVSMHPDPTFEDQGAWAATYGGTLALFKTVTDGPSGRYVAYIPAGTSGRALQWFPGADGTKCIPINPNKQYRLSFWYRVPTGSSGSANYATLQERDSTGALIGPNAGHNFYMWTAGAIAAGAWARVEVSAGAGTINTFNAATRFVSPSFLFNWETAGGELQIADIRLAERVDGSLLVDGAVSTEKLTAGAVTAGSIAAGAVTTNKIAAGAVTAGSIAANAITSDKIAAGAVTAGSIAAGAVTAGSISVTSLSALSANMGALNVNNTLTLSTNGVLKTSGTGYDGNGIFLGWDGSAYKFSIGNGTGNNLSFDGAILTVPAQRLSGAIASGVTGLPEWLNTNITINANGTLGGAGTGQINLGNLQGQVTAAQIAANAVTAGSIAANAITSDKIAANAITAGLVAANAILSQNIAANAITAGSIAANAVTTGSIAANAITSALIAANAITAGSIAANAVTTAKIAAGAITAGSIAANAVTAGSIAANAITSDKIAANAVTAGSIAANAVSADKIAANAVTAGSVAAGAITASKLVLGDSSNMIPGADLSDSGAWNLGTNVTIVTTADANVVTLGATRAILISNVGISSQYSIANPRSNEAVNNDFFGVEPNAHYRISAKCLVKNTFNGQAYVILRFYNSDRATYTDRATSIFDGTTNAKVGDTIYDLSYIGQAPSTAVFLEIFYLVQWTSLWATRSNTGTVYFANPRVHRAMAGELVVDGAITASKIAVGAVTAGSIAANAITSDKISAGAVTAEKLTVSSFGDSVLLNPGFEIPSSTDPTLPSNWTRNVVWGTVNATLDATNANSGNYCIALAPGAGASSDLFADGVPVSEGETWFMSCKARSSGTNAGTSPGFYFRVRGGATQTSTAIELYIGVENTSVPTTWTTFSGTITIPAGMKWARVFVLNYQTNTGHTVYVDDVEFKKVIVSAIIGNGAVTAGKIAANAVTANNIAAGAVTAGSIAANAISSDKIAAGAITAGSIASNAISSDKIAAGAITAGSVAAKAITADKLVLTNSNNIITNPVMELGTSGYIGAPISALTSSSAPSGCPTSFAMKQEVLDVYSEWIDVYPGEVYNIGISAAASSGVTSANFGVGFRYWGTDNNTNNWVNATGMGEGNFPTSNSVWTTKSGQWAVPANVKKIAVWLHAEGYRTGTNPQPWWWTNLRLTRANSAELIVDGAITTGKIAAGAITAGSIAANAISSDKIAAGAITAGSIAANAISSDKIAAGAITAGSIAANAITSDKISAGAITAGSIAANAVTAGSIASNAITTAKIAAGAITSGSIASNSITTDKLLVTGRGAAINDDPFTSDASAWPSQGLWSATWTIQTITDGPSGNTVIRSNAGANQTYAGSRQIPFNPKKSYRVRCKARSVGTVGTFYLVVDLRRSNNSIIQRDGTAWYYPASGVTVPSTWQDYEGSFGFGVPDNPFPTDAVTMSVGALMNFTGGTGYHEVQDLRIEEMADASLIVNGAITASKIAVGAVTAGSIAANAISSDKIAAGAITAGSIASNAISSDKIAAGAITAGSIAANAVTAGSIASGAITASKIVVSNQDSVFPDPGWYDRTWWAKTANGYSIPATNLVFANESSTWPVRRILQFSGNIGTFDFSTESFPIELGASYRYKVTIYKASNFAGKWAVHAHFPEQAWFVMGIPRSATVTTTASLLYALDMAAIPTDAWTSYTSVYTNSASLLNASNPNTVQQFRFSGVQTAGDMHIAIEMVRANGSDLIVDGAITASKMTIAEMSKVASGSKLSGGRIEMDVPLDGSNNSLGGRIRIYGSNGIERVRIGYIA